MISEALKQILNSILESSATLEEKEKITNELKTLISSLIKRDSNEYHI